ncbi:nucleotidyltransferase family protein [Polycyclovorans algicola]|uniref:nucleotidyltransferase family protein n=1 Tax=Polycyclovorans algicola TaxID=616992 RepID=UPI0004A7818C|nr:nucleotidyltransferase family protein [Polycyclovorans algicola]
MSLPTAIVLAGGFGTRLQSVVADVPKPMAPVAGRPFLQVLLDTLADAGVTGAVLAVGYKREVIEQHFGAHYRGIALDYSVEAEPLGTGGAIRQAFEQAGVERALVLNGDTWCPVDLLALVQTHRAHAAMLTLTLTQVPDAGRFGAVTQLPDGRVSAFHEKRSDGGAGRINAGVYVVERALMAYAPTSAKFSFETDVMQRVVGTLPVFGHVTDAPFIDIGIPSEFARAQGLFA